MDYEEILKASPIREPVLCVDGNCEIEYGKFVKGYKNGKKSEEWARGHFIDEPVFPGTMIIEAMAQIGGFIFYNVETKQSVKGFLSKVDKVKFLKKVVPDCRMYIEASLIAKSERIAKISCKALIDNSVVASGEITLFYTNEI